MLYVQQLQPVGAFSPASALARQNTRNDFDFPRETASLTIAKSSTTLFSEPPSSRKKTNDALGIQRGLYLMAIVMFFNVWIFSIPPEFRRAKICTEEQVINFPDSGCTTVDKWATGISDYYANGGGVHFDFSIDKSSQPAWMGGEQPRQK